MHLVVKYGVSARTIYYDVQILSLSYPIETARGRYHAGIRIPGWYKLNPKAYTPAQHELLLELKADLSGHDLVIMASIIEQFAE